MVIFLTSSDAAVLKRSFLQKAVLKNFAEFIGKHLQWNLFFSRISDVGTTSAFTNTCNVFVKLFPTLLPSVEFCCEFQKTLANNFL